MKLPTEQEWKEWQQHPATLALRKVLGNWQSNLKEQWAAGVFTDQSQFATAISNAKAIGNCEVIGRLIDFEYEQLEGEMNAE
jgi:hypothetical protein